MGWLRTPVNLFPSRAGTGRGGDDGAEFQWIRDTLARTQQVLSTLGQTEELHRLLFEKVPHPRFVCEAGTLQILTVNEAAVRHYGYSRREFLKMKLTDLSAPDSAARFRTYCWNRTARRRSRPAIEAPVFRHRRRDGTLFDVAIDTTEFSMSGRRVLLLMAQDVTQKRRAEQRVRIQQAVTRALAEYSTVVEASAPIFQAVCHELGCDWGELWRVDPSVQLLRCIKLWHPGPAPMALLERKIRGLTFGCGEGIAGMVWSRNRPIWLTNLTRPKFSARLSMMSEQGFSTVVAFPIRLNHEVLGVVTIFSRQRLSPDKHLLRLLQDICSQISQVMGRRRAERQLLEISEREQQRIGQDLHDGLCQRLAGVAYMASDLQVRLDKKSLPETAIAARISELSRETAVQARQIARGLNPVKVGTVGLVAALDELTASIRSMFSITCRFDCSQRFRIRDHETAVHLYRITQEAIHNAVTHGRASEIVVSLQRRKKGITLRVKDNGRGLKRDLPNGSGMGCENMNYRARTIGARLAWSVRPGGGTVMTCELPTHEGRNP
jgi:PAS domain S-box-containing protein